MYYFARGKRISEEMVEEPAPLCRLLTDNTRTDGTLLQSQRLPSLPGGTFLWLRNQLRAPIISHYRDLKS